MENNTKNNTELEAEEWGWSVNRDFYDYDYEDTLCWYLERLFLAGYNVNQKNDYINNLPLEVVIFGVKSGKITLEDLGTDKVEFMTLRTRDAYKRLRYSVRRKIKAVFK